MGGTDTPRSPIGRSADPNTPLTGATATKAYVAKLRSILRYLGDRARKASVSAESPTPVVAKTPREFEDRLEAALVKCEKKWNLAWLNAPFTLWAFSAGALGLLSYGFNNYSSCISLQRTDNRQISKLFYEIYVRREKISSLCDMEESLESLKDKMKTLDPNQTYIFADFKGKKLVEIAFDLDAAMHRWNLVSETTTKITPGGDKEQAKQCPSAPSHPVEPPPIDSDREQAEQSPLLPPNPLELPPFVLSSDYWSSAYFRFVNSAIQYPPHDVLQEAQALFPPELDKEEKATAIIIRPAELSKEEKEIRAMAVIAKIKIVAGNLRNEPSFAKFLSPEESGEVVSACRWRTFWPI